jgi:hypothetical protein
MKAIYHLQSCLRREIELRVIQMTLSEAPCLRDC